MSDQDQNLPAASLRCSHKPLAQPQPCSLMSVVPSLCCVPLSTPRCTGGSSCSERLELSLFTGYLSFAALTSPKPSPRPSPRSPGASEIRLHKPFPNHLTDSFRVLCVRVTWAGSKEPSRLCSGFEAPSFSHSHGTSASRTTCSGHEVGPGRALQPSLPRHPLPFWVCSPPWSRSQSPTKPGQVLRSQSRCPALPAGALSAQLATGCAEFPPLERL